MVPPSRCIAASIVLGCLTTSIQTAADTVSYDYEIDFAPTPVAATGDATAPVAMQQTVTDPTIFAGLVPTFSMYPAVDYIPNMEPAPMFGVQDIVDGNLLVFDAVECALECAAVVGCNAASYYGDNPVETWPGGNNCYLKTLSGCDVPPDATPTADDTLFLIGGPSCAGAMTPMPAPAVDISISPMAAPLPPTPITPVSAITAVPAVPPAPTVLSEAASPMTVPDAPPIAAAAPTAAAEAPLGDPPIPASAPLSIVSEQSGLDSPTTSGDALAAVPAPNSSIISLPGSAFSVVFGMVLVLAAL